MKLETLTVKLCVEENKFAIMVRGGGMTMKALTLFSKFAGSNDFQLEGHVIPELLDHEDLDDPEVYERRMVRADRLWDESISQRSRL